VLLAGDDARRTAKGDRRTAKWDAGDGSASGGCPDRRAVGTRIRTGKSLLTEPVLKKTQVSRDSGTPG
jgi:hypothetical protein